MEKYLENGALSDEEIVRGLEDVVYAGSFVPIFCAAGGREIGTIALLNDIIDLMPSPVKATQRVAQGKDGEEKLRVAQDRLTYWRGVGAQASPTVERLIKQAAQATPAAAPAAA